METRSRMSRSLHTNRDFEKLEPYEGKPSRTVLRGEEGSNALDLPDNHILEGNYHLMRSYTILMGIKLIIGLKTWRSWIGACILAIT